MVPHFRRHCGDREESRSHKSSGLQWLLGAILQNVQLLQIGPGRTAGGLPGAGPKDPVVASKVEGDEDLVI